MILILIGGTFEIKAFDTPNDAGRSVNVTWKIPEDIEVYEGVEIYRGSSPEGPFEFVKFVPYPISSYKDMGLVDGKKYYYKGVLVISPEERIESAIVGPAIPKPQWINTEKLFLFANILFFTLLLLYLIRRARKGKEMFLRPIPGLEAVDEAVGRATEMGKPILYIPGLSTIDDIATIASLNILSHVTRKAGEYETRIIVPNRDPMVYTVAREIVKEAYTSIGRPDLFNPEDVYFITTRQFGYAAAVSGIMVREKPATNFLIGMFWAESLILAETGTATGAIQIAGTDAVTQLPFFIVACDYTLIGEELYAASAYLSREPLLTATLKGQDFMKFLLGFSLVLGSILNFWGITFLMNLFKGG
jgi:hypothetical protein